MNSIEFLLIKLLYHFPAITTKTSEANDSRRGFILRAGFLYFVDSNLNEKQDMTGWLDLGQQELEAATCYILADREAQSARRSPISLPLGKESPPFFSKSMVGACEGMKRYGEGMVTGEFPLLQWAGPMHL